MTLHVQRWAVLACLAVLLACSLPCLAQSAQAVYEKQCVFCHGKDGSGRTAAATRMRIPDLRSREVQQLPEETVFDTIANGTGHKQYPHAFAKRGLTSVTIHDLVGYVRELGSPAKK
jgi:mono/diheme cytochrome c family protein